MKTSQWLTIPNLLSGYRLLSFPLLLYLCFSSNEKIFATLLIINLLTDVLDGLIARSFNQQTALGARLDSIADVGSYILAFCGIFTFKVTIIAPYLPSFLFFLALYLLVLVLFPLIKFGRFTSFHLYSSKSAGYLQGLLFITIFAGYFSPFLYYLAIGWGILSMAEHLCLQIMLPHLKSDVKGLYWVLKKTKADSR